MIYDIRTVHVLGWVEKIKRYGQGMRQNDTYLKGRRIIMFDHVALCVFYQDSVKKNRLKQYILIVESFRMHFCSKLIWLCIRSATAFRFLACPMFRGPRLNMVPTTHDLRLGNESFWEFGILHHCSKSNRHVATHSREQLERSCLKLPKYQSFCS